MLHIYMDLDDTLLQTQKLFEKFKRSCANFILIEENSDSLLWGEVYNYFEERERINMALYGYKNERFITSWKETYTRFIPNGQNADAVGRLAEMVFTTPAQLVDHAIDCLEYITHKGYPITLITCGVEDVQKRRIQEAGIEHYFKDIRVVPEKTAEIMESIVTDKDKAFMIGNSVRSDINPSIEIGIPCMQVESPSWNYDEVPKLEGGVVYYGTLENIPEILHEAEWVTPAKQ